MAILSPSPLSGQIRDLISTIANLFALLISSIFLSLVIYKLVRCNTRDRKKLFKETSVLLTMNTLLILITRSTIQFLDIDLNTIRRNYLSISDFRDSFFCRFRGYLILSIHNTLYWSYALNALFRLARVIFPHRRRLHQSSTYLYLFIPIQFLVGFVSILPIWIPFNAVYLLPNEPYCTASYDQLPSLIYMPMVAFVLPLTIISVSYMTIVWKMRWVTTAVGAYQSRNRRDFVVIRRIVIIIIILSVVSLPILIDLFVYLPKGYRDPNMNSITLVSSSVNAVILTISLPLVDPKMSASFKKTNTVDVQIELIR